MSTKKFANFSDAQLLEFKRTAVNAVSQKVQPANAAEAARLKSHAPIVASLAKNLSDEEWIQLLREGIQPETLALTPKQLEQTKGGITVGDILDGWPLPSPTFPDPTDPFNV